MHERYKIDEAKFFLERMEESIHSRRAFRNNLSAFLTAARSVLQYARKESRSKSGQQWYDKTVANYEVLSYFKNKRDVNIHEEPVNPSIDVSIETAAAFCVVASTAPVVVVSGDEPVATVQTRQEPSPPSKEESPPPTHPENRSRTTVRYRFNDWLGPEDVIGLSHLYIEELEKFVQRGMEEGMLSG